MILRRSYQVLAAFLQMQLAGGVVLFAAALLAMIAANDSFLAEHYAHFLHVPVGITIDGHLYTLSMSHFINDGLMAVFFLLVGLEIKRELLVGELSSRSRAMLPALAAAGGMIGPAVIYVLFNLDDTAALRGWAIPTATDIAFSLGVLSLLGKRVPFALKIFLLAIAVIDDLLAIAIIAVFYSGELAAVPLLLSLGMIVVLFFLNRGGVCSRVPYMLAGLVLWACVLQSGVHATLAGVATALAVPLRTPPNKQSPLEPLEHDLHALVTFLILPFFAFANAGVSVVDMTISDVFAPLPLGIMVGLLVGKPIGIVGATWLVVRSGYARLPIGCSWAAVVSMSLLCGIGFTVSLFIGNLAFADNHPEMVNAVKLGVLCGSAVAGTLGYLLLRLVYSGASQTDRTDSADEQ